MSSTKVWYPHYIERYRRKTGHLTIAEHGAYRLLMDAYWDNRGPLPADDNRLRRLIGADREEWDAVKEAVLAFFVLTPDGWLHETIEEVIAKADKQHAEKAERMAAARSRRWSEKQQGSDQITDQSSDQITDQKSEQITSTSLSSSSYKNQEPRIGADDVGDVSHETPPSKPKRTPRDALCEVLDEERAAALIEHRNKLRAPLTVRAAEMLGRDLMRARDGPAAAADLMLSRGWKGFKPEWDRNDGKSSVDDTRQAILRAVVG